MELNEWLDDFQMMGVKLNEGEKTLMRMAIRKENERIIKLLEKMPFQVYQAVALDGKVLDSISTPKVLNRDDVLALIKEKNK